MIKLVKINDHSRFQCIDTVYINVEQISSIREIKNTNKNAYTIIMNNNSVFTTDEESLEDVMRTIYNRSPIHLLARKEESDD